MSFCHVKNKYILLLPPNRLSHFGKKLLGVIRVKSPQCDQIDNVKRSTAKHRIMSTTFKFKRIITKYNGVCYNKHKINKRIEKDIGKCITTTILAFHSLFDDDNDDTDAGDYLKCQPIDDRLFDMMMYWQLS